MNKVERIKAWANEHYEESYGASCIVECMEDDEIDAEFPTFEAAVEYAGLKDGQYADVTAEIF